MELIQTAKHILQTLIEAGHEAVIVGGYVRDQIIERETSDVDIATSAKPEEVERLFKKTILTGVKHGTITVILGKFQFEVTTFRKEGAYEDFRHPDQVIYVNELEEDVKRRDFTMNALALTIDDKVIDYVGGITDIQQKMIKTVGNASDRFKEDALRMLRAFRFMSKLGFNLDDDVSVAINQNCDLIANISKERIIKELEALIKGDYYLQAISKMVETDFASSLSYFKQGLYKMDEVGFKPHSMIEFLAVCTVCDGISILDELPIANYLKKEVKVIYEMISLGITDFNRVLLFRNGLESCLSVNHINVYLNKTADQKEQIKSTYEALPIHRQCDLKFKGDEIIEMFQKPPGAWISTILDDICLKVLLGELENDYEKIRQYLLKKQ